MADFEKNIEMERIFAPFIPDEDHYIFVSYSHADRERVFPIITRLYEKGWHIWYDQGIPYGEDYDEVILRHLDECEVFLLFITENSVLSEYVSKREMPHACNTAKTIVQCQLDESVHFPDMIQRKLDFATEMKEFHPMASENDLETVLGHFVQCFEPRKAKGFWNLTKANEIPIWEDDESFEYVKKQNGICLGKYLGKEESVSVPPIYKGFPVLELDDTFYDNATVKAVYIPEGIKKLSYHCFSHCPNLNDLYLPSSYSVNCMDKWDFEINPIRTIKHKITLHCIKDSDAYRLANRLKWRIKGLKIKADYYRLASSTLESHIKRNFVYCSLSEQDEERFKGLLQRLTNLGCTILDSVSMPASEKLKLYLDSKVFLALISRTYLASSEFQFFELSCQTKKDRILWMMEDCQLPAKLSLFVENEQQIRYDNGNLEEQILKLVDALQKKGCLSADASTQEFDYRVTKDGLFLSGYHGDSIDLHIPESLSGVPVIGIENLRLARSKTERIVLPNGLKYIGEAAFSDCTWLRGISLPSSLTSVGNYAFEGCSNLREISLPSSLTSVGNYAFKGCSNLREISLPDGLTSIGNSAFEDCASLHEITLPKEITIITRGLFEGCFNLRKIDLPLDVFKIEDCAFSNCKSLCKISIPDSVNDIGAYVFCDTTTVICSRNSYAWRYCERKEIPHKTQVNDDHNTDLQNDFEDIFKLFE